MYACVDHSVRWPRLALDACDLTASVKGTRNQRYPDFLCYHGYARHESVVACRVDDDVGACDALVHLARGSCAFCERSNNSPWSVVLYHAAYRIRFGSAYFVSACGVSHHVAGQEDVVIYDVQESYPAFRKG